MTRLLYSNTEDFAVTRAQLATIDTPEPQGPRHQPYPFFGFANQVVDAIVKAGHTVVEEEYAVTKDNLRLFGLVHVNVNNLPVPGDYRQLVGLRGAHDMAFGRAITLGSQVMVCSNLCFHGDLGVWKTKQSTHIADRLPGLIDLAIRELPAAAQALSVNFDRLRESQLSPQDGVHKLAQIYRSDGLSAAQLGKAVDEWFEPSHVEFEDDGWSAWRLFNAATEAIKPSGSSGEPVYLQRKAEIIHQHFAPVNHPRS